MFKIVNLKTYNDKKGLGKASPLDLIKLKPTNHFFSDSPALLVRSQIYFFTDSFIVYFIAAFLKRKVILKMDQHPK